LGKSPEVLMTTSSASPNILLVKLSSLGDVLHNLPIVWDIRARLPNARIDWVVEEGYVHLLEPLLTNDHFRGIDRIIPFGLRRWKNQYLACAHGASILVLSAIFSGYLMTSLLKPRVY